MNNQKIKSGPFGTVLEFSESAKLYGLNNGLRELYEKHELGSGVSLAFKKTRRSIVEVLRHYQRSGVEIFDVPTFRVGACHGREIDLVRKSILLANNITKIFRNILGDEAILWGDFGPYGDCYTGEDELQDIELAKKIYLPQILASRDGGSSAILGETFTGIESPIGFAKAANEANIPVYLSFYTDSEGKIPGNFSTNEKNELEDVIKEVDKHAKVESFGLNCGSEKSILKALSSMDPKVSGRVHLIYPNAASNHGDYTHDHECKLMTNGGVDSLIKFHRDALEINPNIEIVGGCCGFTPTDYEYFVSTWKSSIKEN